MTGVTIRVTTTDLDRVAANLARIGSLPRALILDKLGAIGETQTKKRIATEKTAPDGGDWPANRAGTSILVRDGHLRDSVHHAVEGDSAVRWGSGLVYAAIHQVGGTIRPVQARSLVFAGPDGALIFARSVRIPARPYLGVSAANARQIERHLVTLVGQHLQEG